MNKSGRQPEHCSSLNPFGTDPRALKRKWHLISAADHAAQRDLPEGNSLLRISHMPSSAIRWCGRSPGGLVSTLEDERDHPSELQRLLPRYLDDISAPFWDDADRFHELFPMHDTRSPSESRSNPHRRPGLIALQPNGDLPTVDVALLQSFGKWAAVISFSWLIRCG